MCKCIWWYYNMKTRGVAARSTMQHTALHALHSRYSLHGNTLHAILLQYIYSILTIKCDLLRKSKPEDEISLTRYADHPTFHRPCSYSDLSSETASFPSSNYGWDALSSMIHRVSFSCLISLNRPSLLRSDNFRAS